MKNMTDGRADEAWFSGERNKVGGDVEEKRVGACHQFDCMVAGRAGGKKLASPAGGFVSAVPAAPDRPGPAADYKHLALRVWDAPRRFPSLELLKHETTY